MRYQPKVADVPVLSVDEERGRINLVKVAYGSLPKSELRQKGASEVESEGDHAQKQPDACVLSPAEHIFSSRDIATKSAEVYRC